jgi:hypothetical protein
MPHQEDPRAVLGLPFDANRADAQRAFRRLAKQTHPDTGGDAAAFRTVAGAWAELGPLLPPEPQQRPVAPAQAPAPLSPHVLAYRMTAPGRTVWAERRPVAARRRPDFAAVLQAEMARLAA